MVLNVNELRHGDTVFHFSQELVGMLRDLKVQYLVLPAVPSVCAMWQEKFGFEPLGYVQPRGGRGMWLEWMCVSPV